ncbi:MAG: hypothetical protein RIK87_16980 [Fuerstiella sp.]
MKISRPDGSQLRKHAAMAGVNVCRQSHEQHNVVAQSETEPGRLRVQGAGNLIRSSAAFIAVR